MKTIVVYFSVSGHTKDVGAMVAAEGNFNIIPIVPQSSYTNDLIELEKRAGFEFDNNMLPKLDMEMKLFDSYSHIFLGTPVWFGNIAPAVKTFIHIANLRGKTIHPFFTCGGMPGASVNKMSECLADKSAVMTEPLMVKYSHIERLTEDAVIQRWVNNHKVKYHIS